jgi:hypothetical protein
LFSNLNKTCSDIQRLVQVSDRGRDVLSSLGERGSFLDRRKLSTDPFLAFSFTTVPIPISDLGVALPTSDLSAFSLTGSGYRGGPLTGVILDAGGVGIIHLSYASAATANPTFFAAADYSSPGTYTGAASATMVVTAVATPEPGSLVFMLSGVGLVFAMRKRFSDLQQAS